MSVVALHRFVWMIGLSGMWSRLVQVWCKAWSFTTDWLTDRRRQTEGQIDHSFHRPYSLLRQWCNMWKVVERHDGHARNMSCCFKIIFYIVLCLPTCYSDTQPCMALDNNVLRTLKRNMSHKQDINTSEPNWKTAFNFFFCSSSASADSYVSTLSCPEPSCLIKEMTKCRWTGLITSDRIQTLIQAARSDTVIITYWVIANKLHHTKVVRRWSVDGRPTTYQPLLLQYSLFTINNLMNNVYKI